MSGHPPPPPPRKPPPAGQPAAAKPAAKPPAPGQGGPGQSGAHAAPPETTSTSTGMIVGIIGAILAVFVGLPLLACGGCCIWSRYQTEQFVAELEQLEQQHDGFQPAFDGNTGGGGNNIQRAAEEQALLVQLTDRLYPQAKVDIGVYWVEPEGVRRRRWADWNASKITDNRYAISGILDLGIKDEGTKTFKWKCEYTTADDPRNAQATWDLQRIEINSEQVYP